MFIPVSENTTKDYFINDSPQNIIEKGKAYDVPWMLTIVSNEGLTVTAGF